MRAVSLTCLALGVAVGAADSLRGQRALVMGDELDSAEAAVLVGTGAS